MILNSIVALSVQTSSIIRNRIKLENVFVLTGLVFGLMFIYFTPPFQVADESRHFARAYQLAERGLSACRLIPARDSLPLSFVEVDKQVSYLIGKEEAKISRDKINQLKAIPLRPEQRAFYANVPNYSPVAYLPQITIIAVLRLSESSIVTMMYWARLMGLLTWLSISFIAFRWLPGAKLIFFVIALLPMTLAQASSTSADGITIALAFLTTAYYFRLAYSKQQVTITQIILGVVLIVALIATKFVYGTLLLLHLLIPRNKFGSTTRFWVSFVSTGIIAVISLIILFVSLYSNSPVNSVSNTVAEEQVRFPQVDFLLANPLSYPKILIATISKHALLYGLSFVGVFGWLDTVMPLYTYIIAYCMLLAVIVCGSDGRLPIDWKHKILFLFVFFLTLIGLLVAVSADLRENPKASFVINGIQGRYFLPVAMPLALVLYNHYSTLKRFKPVVFVIALLTVVYMLTIANYTIFMRYFT